MEQDKQLWNYTLEEIQRGYAQDAHELTCVYCGATYEKGRIYNINEQLYDSEGALRRHILLAHGTAVDYLLKQELTLLGISKIQQQLLELLSDGQTDKEIAKALGIAPSTVRNHKFKLREKEKQAKLYLVLMQSLEEKTNQVINHTDEGVLEEVHPTATMVDARYGITAKEREKTLLTYMDEYGALKLFPAKEKKKIIILGEIMKNFKVGMEYSEYDINKVLRRIHDDYPTLRRALIEYGFMDRSDDCKVYRVKE